MANIQPTMTANNAPSPWVISASSELNGNQAAWMSMDDNSSSYWDSADGLYESSWLKLFCGTGRKVIVTGYSLRSFVDGGYEPRYITMHGSNNDSSWTQLHVTDYLEWTPDEVKPFTVVGAAAYAYIRITFNGITSGTIMVVNQWTLAGSIQAYARAKAILF